MLKLYVLIRDDLSTAQQAVQAGHALAQFGLEHPREFKAWQEDSNTLVYLSINKISWWKQALEDGDFCHSVFHEPDLNAPGSYPFGERGIDTAIAIAPNWACQYILLKDLPLAFQSTGRDTHSTVYKRWWQ